MPYVRWDREIGGYKIMENDDFDIFNMFNKKRKEKNMFMTEKDCDNCGQRCDGYGKGEVCSQWKPKTEPNFKAALKETIKGFKECGVGDLIPNQNAEPRAEKHYRPFRDTDELIKVFCEKTPKIYDKDDEKLFMPYIWVRNKSDSKVWLITEFDNRILDYLFTNCEFLDGTPCGVEE